MNETNETNETMPDLVAAQWHISLDAQCPKCFEWFDVCATENDFLRDVNPAQRGIEDVTCPECGHEFQIDMEY